MCGAGTQGQETEEEVIPLLLLQATVVAEDHRFCSHPGYDWRGPVAAKTGTTSDNRDAWTIGHTPSLAAGVWAGNSDNAPMKESATGLTVAAPIWNAFMREALSGAPIEEFARPEIPHTGKAVLDGELQEQQVPVQNDLPGAAPAGESHSILYYVRRSDPLGEPPGDMERDEAFGAWEEGVTDWIARQQEKSPGSD